MNVSLESCLTLTLALVILSINACQGQGNTCDINSRPHPQGICGSLLSRAHSNLCFLLSRAYPRHFPGKRSVDSTNVVHKIYNIPLSVLAELDVSGDNWGNVLASRENPRSFWNTGSFLPGNDVQLPPASDDQPDFQDARLDRVIFLSKKKRSDRSKRAVSQSSMVCDCCYNRCTPSHLATYC